MKTTIEQAIRKNGLHGSGPEISPGRWPALSLLRCAWLWLMPLVGLMLWCSGLHATTWTVTSTNDDGTGTLRALVDSAGSGDTILFHSSINGNAIVLTSGEISILKDLTIIGNGPANTIIDGNANSMVLLNEFGRTSSVSLLTVTNGAVSGLYNKGTLSVSHCYINGNEAIAYGGGIYSNGILSVTSSTISDNTSGAYGGGIYIAGTATVANSTISGNTAGYGGGIFNVTTLSLSNSTITGNTAVNDGGGVYTLHTGTFHNSIIAGNGATTGTGNDGYVSGGAIDSSCSYNLIGDNTGFSVPSGNSNQLGTSSNPIDPLLGPLADNGGPTQTHALLCNSPAYNTGNTDSTSDQRGQVRGAFGADDIGAFESQEELVAVAGLVINTNNAGCGSLRQVVADASPGDTVRFDNAINGDTIFLSSGQISIPINLTIMGNGPANTVIDGSANSRIFNIGSGTVAAINQITVTNGYESTQGGGIVNFGTLSLTQDAISGNAVGGDGGAIDNRGNLNVDQSTISGNTAGSSGGGIYHGGTNLTLTNSTVSGNASDNGGGIYHVGSNLSVTNSTISMNMADNGGGIFNSGTSDFYNSIIAGNSAPNAPDGYNVLGTINSSSSYNLIGDNTNFGVPFGNNNQLGSSVNPIDPLLGPLADNGGPTQTHALLCGSPAIDGGSTDSTYDQRGEPRGFGGADDIGAFEGQGMLSLLVTNTNDAGCGSLREVIINASAGDTIRFHNSLNGNTILLTSSNIYIDKDLTIMGNGPGNTIIDGNNNSRIFFIDYNMVVALSELTVTNGKVVNEFGGGISSEGILTVTNSSISGNTAKFGGGIANIYGNLTLINTTINGNTAEVGGGGIYNAGTITATNSTVSGNMAGDAGGGIFAFRNSIITLTNTGISGNTAVGTGGGVHVYSLSSLTVNNCAISGNSANYAGGVSITAGSTSSVANSTISQNQADSIAGGIYNDGTLSVTNSMISENQAGSGGGGLYNDDTLNIVNCTLNANTADNGGGIYNDGHFLHIAQSAISGNTGDFGGGIRSDGETFIITQSTINGNMATYTGGGISSSSFSSTVNNSTISGNMAGDAGGGISVGSFGRLTLSNSTISGNMADTSGGGVLLAGFLFFNAEFNSHNSIIAGNSAMNGPDGYNNGGAIDSSSYNLIGDNTGFNVPAGNGNILGDSINSIDPVLDSLANNGGPTWTHALLCGSPAFNTGNTDSLTDQRGQARGAFGADDIGAVESQVNLTGIRGMVTTTNDMGCGSLRQTVIEAVAGDTITFDSSIDGDTIVLTSGAIDIDKALTIIGNGMANTIIDGNANSSLFFVDSSTVGIIAVTLQNGLSVQGGAIQNGGDLTIAGSSINGNSATDAGGGIYNDNVGVLTLTNSIIHKNGSPNGGGGIFNDGGTVAIDSSLLDSNSAGNNGGALFNLFGTASISNSTLHQNSTATNGGGVSVLGSGAELNIFNSTISGNTSNSIGGGIGIGDDCIATISNSTISGNSASQGGGLYDQSGGVVISSSTISGNAASHQGGGIYSNSSSSLMSIVNSTVTANNAAHTGGGIYFSGNQIFLSNSIIAANTSRDGPEYFERAAISSSSSYNLIGDTTGFGFPAGNNNILGDTANPIDPLLGPLADNGGFTKTHALLCGSPAFNAGNTDSLTDQRGEARGTFGADDIGAFESQQALETQSTVFTDSICPGDSLFVGGGWQNITGVYTDTAISAAGCDSLLVTNLYLKPVADCAMDSTETILYLVSDSGWTLSTVVTTATSNSFPWPGAATYLPHDSTFTLPVEVGQPFPWIHLYTVMGSEVIKSGGGVTYYRYEFELTEHQTLNARFRMFVDDDMQIFINRNEIALEDDMGSENWRTANHDILFKEDGTTENGYAGGDVFDSYTSENLDNIFQTGANDVILAIRNRTSKPDVGGFSFRMDLDKAGKGVIVRKSSEAFKPNTHTLVIYPNPTSGNVTVALNKNTETFLKGTLNVMDLSGKQMLSKTIYSETEINLEALPAGVYLVKVVSGDNTYTQKLVKN